MQPTLLELDRGELDKAEIVFDVDKLSDASLQAYLCYLLRSCLKHQCIALHLFLHDSSEGTCLRVLACVPNGSRVLGELLRCESFLVSIPAEANEGDAYVWCETYPIPGIYAEAVLAYIRFLSGCSPGRPDGFLSFVYQGEKRTAAVQVLDKRRLVIRLISEQVRFPKATN